MIAYFTRHPTAANLLMIVLLVAGFYAAPQMRRETFPDFAASELEISVVYIGATAEEVEEGVCRVIEDALDGVANVEEVRSQAFEGRGRIVAKMESGADFTNFEAEVKTEVDAITTLPDLAEEPIISSLGRTDMVVELAVTADLPSHELEAYCDNLKDRLQSEAGVSLVDLKGFSDRQFRVEVDRLALGAQGLSLADVASAIEKANIKVPAGLIETGAADIIIRFDDERTSPRTLRELVVTGDTSGAVIRLEDIATIKRDYENKEMKSLFNGKRAALLTITKTKTEDCLDIYAAVSKFIDKEKEKAPPTVEFYLTHDVSSVVQDRLDLLIENGWMGFLLVLLSLGLFFGFKVAFWVAMGLPVAFAGGLFIMNELGYSLNMMTMVGLLIALGLLMDDAIVIAENIMAHSERGKSPTEAAIDGTSEVAMGVVSSFLTTAAVFVPLFTLTGNMGVVLRVIPAVLLLVLSVSLIEAFLILPRHLCHSIAKSNRDEDGYFLRFRENYVGLAVDWAVKNRYLSLGLTICVFFCSLALISGGIVKFEAFPDLDGDVIQARIHLPAGTPLARTESVVKRVTKALVELNVELSKSQQQGKELIVQHGVTFSVNADTSESGPHLATITADLLPAEERKGAVDDILDRWRILVGVVPDVINLNFTQPNYGPAGKSIEIRLKGNVLSDLEGAANQLKRFFAAYVGVSDLRHDLQRGKPEITLGLRPAATAMGLSANAVANQIRTAFQGSKVQDVYNRGRSFEVTVQAPLKDANSLADLELFNVISPKGEKIPLGNLTTIKRTRGWSVIKRVDGQRTVTLTGSVNSSQGNTADIMREFLKIGRPKVEKMYPSVKVDVQGESKETGKTQSSLIAGFCIGLLGVFVILSFQFRSYLEPFVVMAAIPLAFIGVILGHLILGQPLTTPSIFGFVALAGVVVNDSILLVEFLKTKIASGTSATEAASAASRERLRAIALTSITTIAGLTPLLFETSLQAKALIPLATSTVFGLAASTIMVLVIVPCIYTILDDHKLTERAS